MTAHEIQWIDEIAVERFELSILQMMENTGRALAEHAMDIIASLSDPVVILALPKTGLAKIQSELYLADLGIPTSVYEAVGIQ